MDHEERRRRRLRKREQQRARRRQSPPGMDPGRERREPTRQVADARQAADARLVEGIDEERALRRSEVVLAQRDFESDDEVAAWMDSDEYRDALSRVESTFNLEEKAQEIMFQALACPRFEDAVALAGEAVRLDPDCVDARLILAASLTEDPDEYIDLLFRTAWAGERWLGDEYFEECRGRFWQVATTRPYMRALYQLGVSLLATGVDEDEEEGVAVLRDMLELNPDDDQGARLFLVAVLLRRDELAEARALFEEYQDDLTAAAMWARVLERVLARDEDGARERLELARQWSPGVLERLLADREAVAEEPADDEEFAGWLLWHVVRERPELRDWLRAAAG